MKTTNPQLTQDADAVAEAIDQVGGEKQAAEITGRSSRSVYRWQNDVHSIGYDAAILLTRRCDVSLSEIYPELEEK